MDPNCGVSYPGGGGGDPGLPPDVPQAPPNDALTEEIPTCPVDVNNANIKEKPDTLYMQAYCAGTAPTPDQKELVYTAINSIRARGGDCIQIADLAQQIVDSQDGFHFFPASDQYGDKFNFLGAGSKPPDKDWLIIGAQFAVPGYQTPTFNTNSVAGVPNYTGANITVTLEYDIAHEVDHLLGNEHLRFNSDGTPTSDPQSPYADEYLTKNTLKCSGQG